MQNFGRNAPRDRKCVSIVGWVEPIATRTEVDGYRFAPPILQDWHRQKPPPPPSLSISRYKPCSHLNSSIPRRDLLSGPTNPGLAEETEPDGGCSKITERGAGGAADVAGRNLPRAQGRGRPPGRHGAGRRP